MTKIVPKERNGSRGGARYRGRRFPVLGFGSARLMPTKAVTQSLVCALAMVMWILPIPANACLVCIILPERTLADRVLGDRFVVLARPASDNPFRFEVVKIIRGNSQALAELPQIPLLVDSTTRRRLRADESLSVLMTYGPSGTGSQLLKTRQAWHRLMTVTSPRQKFLEAMLAENKDWEWGMTRDPDRFSFFAERHTHPDPEIQRAALSELERAPYSLIRTVKGTLPAKELLRRLNDKNEIPFAALYALLLSRSDHPRAKDYIRSAFVGALGQSSRLRGAWIVAGIEVGGREALERALANLSQVKAGSSAKRLEIIKALTVTGNAQPMYRDAISLIFHESIQRYPDNLEQIASTLYEWRVWTLNWYFERLLSEDPALADSTRYILQMLVNAAQSDTGRL